MSHRAYAPHYTTLNLLASVLALPEVKTARLVAPTHGTHPRPALFRVEFTDRVRYLSFGEARLLALKGIR